MHKISVLIATYNRDKLLGECLKSLKKQTYKDFEIILVDDGSTDDTKKYDSEVDIYYYQEHQGISAARNKALELMTGEYFFVLDSDDILKPDCLEKHINNIEGYDFIFPYYEYLDTKEVVKYNPQTFKQCYNEKKVPHGGLYRKETLWKYRYDTTLHSAVDYDYILGILKDYPSIQMAVIREPLYVYRVNHKQERGSSGQIISTGIVRTKYL